MSLPENYGNLIAIDVLRNILLPLRKLSDHDCLESSLLHIFPYGIVKVFIRISLKLSENKDWVIFYSHSHDLERKSTAMYSKGHREPISVCCIATPSESELNGGLQTDGEGCPGVTNIRPEIR